MSPISSFGWKNEAAPDLSAENLERWNTTVGAFAELQGKGISPSGGDDWPALSAAAVTGVRVLLAPGKFKLSKTLVVPSSCVLQGASGAMTTIEGLSTGFRPVETVAGATFAGIFDLAVSTAGEEVSAMVLLNGGADHVVERVRVLAGRWGIQASNVARPTIRGCEATGQKGAFAPVGILVSGTSERAWVQNNYVHDGDGLGIFFDSTASTQTVLGHVCTGNHVVKVEDNGIRFETNIAHPEQGHYVCGNNVVEEPKVNCIRVTGYGASVVGNVTRGGTAGVRDTGAGAPVLARSTISGNTCVNTGVAAVSGGIEMHGTATSSTATTAENSETLTEVTNTNFWPVGAPIAGAGIPAGATVTGRDTVAKTLTLSGKATATATLVALTTLGSHDLTITGNYCEGYGHGINYLGAGGTITGNRCVANQGAGIFLQGVTDSTVTGNTCQNNGKEASARGGIELNASCSHVVVDGNRCNDTQTVKTQKYGIRAEAGSDFLTVTGNDVTGNLTKNLEVPSGANHNMLVGNIGGELPAEAVTVGSSPASFVNESGSPMLLLVVGGTVEKIEYGRFNVSGETTTFIEAGFTNGTMLLQPRDRIRITHAGAPTVKSVRSR